jgi:hypothetical protein
VAGANASDSTSGIPLFPYSLIPHSLPLYPVLVSSRLLQIEMPYDDSDGARER